MPIRRASKQIHNHVPDLFIESSRVLCVGYLEVCKYRSLTSRAKYNEVIWMLGRSQGGDLGGFWNNLEKAVGAVGGFGWPEVQP